MNNKPGYFLKPVTLLSICCILWPTASHASVDFKGQLTATQNCEALDSIRRHSNPDNIRLEPGQKYSVVAKNKETGSHYLVEIPGANPSQRWVSVDCGTVSSSERSTTEEKANSPKNEEYLLALSWMPTFCEGKPDKVECQRLAKEPSRWEATHFVLHGLWPQPETNSYCNVSVDDKTFDKNGDWSKLPAVEEKLSANTWQELQTVMPGTLSNLHRHEWVKHGTCYRATPEEYFSEAIALLKTFNNSPVQKLVADKIGESVTIKAIDQSLSDFGNDTGEKVVVKCDKSSRLSELWVNLQGDVTVAVPVSTLLKNAPKAKVETVDSCIVDSAKD